MTNCGKSLAFQMPQENPATFYHPIQNLIVNNIFSQQYIKELEDGCLLGCSTL
jgi:hypothetical protein